MKISLPTTIEYIIEPDGDAFDVLAGPLDAADGQEFHEAFLAVLREEPFEERELLVLTIDVDGEAFVSQINEDYMIDAEEEAWLGLPPPVVEGSPEGDW